MKSLPFNSRGYKILVLTFFIIISTGLWQQLQGVSANDAVAKDGNVIFQYSTLNALLNGLYDGNLTIGELKHYGNVGFGTFNSLNGEMVILEGNVYRVHVDGTVLPVANTEKSPLATIVPFKADITDAPGKPMDLVQLKQHLDSLRPSDNIFYALRIEAKFSQVTARSVPKQKKPYPPAVEILKNQTLLHYRDGEGYLVGFWFPLYMKGVGQPGYHLHFITKDKKKGGHLLDCQLSGIKIEIDKVQSIKMVLPDSEEFQKMNLNVPLPDLDGKKK